MEHTTWLEKVTGNESIRAASIAAGLPQRTLANQVDKGTLSAENVIKIAIAYNAHPVRALVDTGYLDEKYARAVDPASAIRTVTEDELADEVLRRMKIGVRTDALTTPVDKIAHLDDRRPVTPTVTDEDEDAFAADSSPDEREERYERGEDPID